MTGPLGEGDPRHAQAVEAVKMRRGRAQHSTTDIIDLYFAALAEQGVVLVEAATRADQFTEELVLRLVDAADLLAAAKTDEDGELDPEQAHGLLSALDYALRGDPGCIEPAEADERRRQALAKYGEYLGLGEPVEAATKPCEKCVMRGFPSTGVEHDANGQEVPWACPKCGGCGWLADGPELPQYDCPKCGGRGRVGEFAHRDLACETCGGTGEESRVVPGCCRQFLPDGQCCGTAVPAEERDPCPKCGGSGSVPVALVDRDALVGEIAEWLRKGAKDADEAFDDKRAVVLERLAAGLLRRFAPGNQEDA